MARVYRRGFALSLQAIICLGIIFTLLIYGAYHAHEMSVNQHIDMIKMEADAIDSALQEYAQAHKVLDREPASQYSTREAADSRLRVMRDKQKNEVLAHGFSPGFPLGIKKNGKVQNQQSGGNATDEGLDFGYFSQKIEFCENGERPSSNNLDKFLYIPLDQYGNRVTDEAFPPTQYLLVVAVKGPRGNVLYYTSEGSYGHEQFSETPPALMR